MDWEGRVRDENGRGKGIVRRRRGNGWRIDWEGRVRK